MRIILFNFLRGIDERRVEVASTFARRYLGMADLANPSAVQTLRSTVLQSHNPCGMIMNDKYCACAPVEAQTAATEQIFYTSMLRESNVTSLATPDGCEGEVQPIIA